MKTAVHFGLGKIGRGFLGELLHNSGYRVVFIDVVDVLVDLINKDHSYTLFSIDRNFEERVIDNVTAVSSVRQESEAIQAIAEAVTISTSIMFTNLPKIAPLLAKGLKARIGAGREKAIVMACENAIMGTDHLRELIVDTGILTAEELDSVAAFPNVAVDRLALDGTHNGKDGIEVSDAFELAIERQKLPNPEQRPVLGAEYVDNLDMFLQRKIYMINCGHALSGYYGHQKGYETVQDALRDQEIQSEVRAAVLEAASGLEKKYGFTHESLLEYMETMMFKRFLCPGIADAIDRVSREPIRKLSANDRIMGPAYLCEEYGLENIHLLKGAACAMKFWNPEDPQAVELQNYIAEHGVEAAITKYTSAEPGSRVFRIIREEYGKLS
ncbi:MAG: mannitol-1-phosphate 5-dehydrogenase [Clostridiales bacterium]|nr:mannitol-1-phosphate 5-dehydrogenase [Clostridiales bacterium]